MSRIIFCVGLIAFGLIAEQAHAQLGRARRNANSNDNNTTRQSDGRGFRSSRNATTPLNAPQPNFNTRNSIAGPVPANNTANGNPIFSNPATGATLQPQGTVRSGQVLSGPTINNGPQLAGPVLGSGNMGPPVGTQAQSVMKVPAVGGSPTTPRGLEENVIPLHGNAATIIANPAATRGPVKFTINGEAVTLQAGSEITLDSNPSYVIEFTRGGGLGKTRYTLTAGTNYNFTVAASGWDLGSAPADDVAPAAPAAPPGATLESLPNLPMPPVPGK